MTTKISILSALLLAAITGTAAASCFVDTAQADFQTGIAANVDLTTSPGNVLLATASGSGPTLDQQNLILGTGGEVFSATQWTGQSFTAGVSGPLSRVDLNLFCYGCTTTAPPPITISIRAAVNGLPTGSDLSTASLRIDQTGAGKFYSANFASPTTVAAGSQYAIVIRPSAAFSAGLLAFSNSAVDSTHGNNSYAGGEMYYSTTSGSTWLVQTFGSSSPPQTADGGFKTYVGSGSSGYVAAGDLISSVKDSNPGTGTTSWTTLSFTDAVPASTQVRFQAAASNSSSGPFTFVGPDGTGATYFTTTGASLAQFNGSRFLKYRTFLSSSNSASTPTLNDATVCYSVAAPASADLSITNTDNTTTAVPGQSVTYSLVASNLGPNSATGATVADTFPPSLTCSWTCTPAGGAACPASGSGSISALVNLPVGATASFSATCSIAASATGTLTNTASITPPGGLPDPVATNNSMTDSDTLSASTNVAITINDSVGLVRVGDVVNYVIEVTNFNAASNATVTVTDTLPTQLGAGSWVCSATSPATCGSASGSGTSLSDKPSLPTGSKVDYTYTATVLSADASGGVSNSASAKVSGGGNQAAGNISATDTDTVVIFNANFESAAKTVSLGVTGGSGGASATAQLGVDAALLNRVTVAPVTIATGRAADGRRLFSVELMRIGANIAMRTLTTIDATPFSDVSPWQTVNLKQGNLALAWRAASSRGDDGFLRNGSLPLTANNSTDNLASLQVETENDIPWLVPVEP
jgi:uncharacterized repeat protein (TIGR01451 family)